jgi:hypothetical protein
MDTKDGREPASPVTGPMRVSLIRDLALAAHTHRQLADRYGRSVQAISQFSSRNADEINDVRLEMSEPMEVWGVRKEEQIALIREQIDRARARIESGELTATQEKGWGNLLIKAIHQLSEITGQLPARTLADFSGPVQVVHEIGVDMTKAFPSRPASGSPPPAPSEPPPQEPEPAPEPAPDRIAILGEAIVSALHSGRVSDHDGLLQRLVNGGGQKVDVSDYYTAFGQLHTAGTVNYQPGSGIWLADGVA